MRCYRQAVTPYSHQDFCLFPKLSWTVIFLKPYEERVCDMAGGPTFEGGC